ncbi:MutS-related protein [Sphingobacterium sp. HJSM2_6]|uniref:MutS-related protein n=1 Tax=Sphingobacterium sp. HJSM2_6 TaxID=3366264 RepID=UPI003BE00DB6
MEDKFLIDQQTLRDLQLRDVNTRSIFDYFDQGITEGAQLLMLSIFYEPLMDVQAIKHRQMLIKRLEKVAHVEFPFYRIILMDLEKYIQSRHSGIKRSIGIMDIVYVKSPIYYYKTRNIIELSEFLIKLLSFYKQVDENDEYEDLREQIDIIEICLAQIFKKIPYDTEKLKINIFNVDDLDRLIRFELGKYIKKIIPFFYEIDAYLAVAKIAKANAYCYPEVFEKNETGKVKMQGVYHIYHKKPVKNDIVLNNEKRIWFLTGANMAGKSSIIKSISTAVYLTHIGFPVPADAIQMDLLDGLFTSINLQDNLELGYSHFYVEAIRLKEIMGHLKPHSNALIILDELFKGTNHTDASKAIYEVMKELAQVKGPYLIVSSHITELADQLQEIPMVDFYKMEIGADSAGQPEFTYKIVPGIADEKLGMWLLKKSGAFDEINRLKEVNPSN